MDQKKNLETIIIKEGADPIRLSEYLKVLSNEERLKILKLIEKEPKDITTISNEIKTTYVNTRKHIDKLLKIGVIIVESEGRTATPKGYPVRKYSLVPGGLEMILRNLGEFSNIKLGCGDEIERIKEMISEEPAKKVPVIKILGGADDGKLIPIRKHSVNIGRKDVENKEKYDPINDIILSASYMAVTRVSKPHAKLSSDGKAWYIEDCESKGGTYINNKKLEKYKKVKLANGDTIWLSKGTEKSMGACLLFSF